MTLPKEMKSVFAQSVAQQLAKIIVLFKHLGVVHDLFPSNLGFVNEVLKVTCFPYSYVCTDYSSPSKKFGPRTSQFFLLYHAPEIILGEEYVPYKADVYTLGVIVLEILVGDDVLPPDIQSCEALFEFYQSGGTLTSKHSLQLPPSFNDLLCQILTRDPNSRPTPEHIISVLSTTY
ncbi:hypothetical protein Pelo_10153 [Pelomyxa schiedti]|nr:hypothetical protein Pelo_10153 [Pelomyxa schiedti]